MDHGQRPTLARAAAQLQEPLFADTVIAEDKSVPHTHDFDVIANATGRQHRASPPTRHAEANGSSTRLISRLEVRRRTRLILDVTCIVQDCPRRAANTRDVVRNLEPRQATVVMGVEFRRQPACLIDKAEMDVELARQIVEGGSQRRTAVGA